MDEVHSLINEIMSTLDARRDDDSDDSISKFIRE